MHFEVRLSRYEAISNRFVMDFERFETSLTTVTMSFKTSLATVTMFLFETNIETKFEMCECAATR